MSTILDQSGSSPTPAKEGWRAFQNGVPRSANPYANRDSTAAREWDASWDAIERLRREGPPPDKIGAFVDAFVVKTSTAFRRLVFAILSCIELGLIGFLVYHYVPWWVALVLPMLAIIWLLIRIIEELQRQ